MAALMLYYHFIVPCTCERDISAGAICYLLREEVGCTIYFFINLLKL